MKRHHFMDESKAPVTSLEDVRCILRNDRTGELKEFRPRIEDEIKEGNGFQFPGGHVKKVVLSASIPISNAPSSEQEEDLSIEFLSQVLKANDSYSRPSDLKVKINLSRMPKSNQARHFSHENSINLYTLRGVALGLLQKSMIEAFEFNFRIAFYENKAGPYFSDNYQLKCGLNGKENEVIQPHPLF
jgi:hypothetical protein